jgi:hypothetical protein
MRRWRAWQAFKTHRASGAGAEPTHFCKTADEQVQIQNLKFDDAFALNITRFLNSIRGDIPAGPVPWEIAARGRASPVPRLIGLTN